MSRARKQAWLVVATIVGVAILLGLGFWQRSRLAWKTDYLAAVDRAVEADPLRSLRELERALAAGEPVDYRRIALAVDPVPGTPMYRLFRGNAGGGFLWERFVAARAAESRGGKVLVGYDVVGDDMMEAPDLPPTVFGHVRHYPDMDDLKGGNYSVEGNRYYRFNQDGLWSASIDFPGEEIPANLWIDADPAVRSVDAIPVRRPDIANNHFQYMLTWWSFAVVLLVIATLLYRREAQA